MSDVLVRRARVEEYSAVGELTVAAYRADGFLEYDSGEAYAEVLADATRRAEYADLFVAVDATSDLLGTVTVVRPGTAMADMCREGEAEVRMLAVAPRGRRRGIGEALTRAAVDRAAELGLARVVLSSLPAMTPAHRLYVRFGFHRAPDRDWTTSSGVPLLAFTYAI